MRPQLAEQVQLWKGCSRWSNLEPLGRLIPHEPTLEAPAFLDYERRTRAELVKPPRLAAFADSVRQPNGYVGRRQLSTERSNRVETT